MLEYACFSTGQKLPCLNNIAENCYIIQRSNVSLKVSFNENGHFKSGRKSLIIKAPQVGLEPTTLRLTAECSAIELLRKIRALARRLFASQRAEGACNFYSRRFA